MEWVDWCCINDKTVVHMAGISVPDPFGLYYLYPTLLPSRLRSVYLRNGVVVVVRVHG